MGKVMDLYEQISELGTVVVSLCWETDRPGGSDFASVTRFKSRYWVFTDWDGYHDSPFRSIKEALKEMELDEILDTTSEIHSPTLPPGRLIRYFTVSKRARPGQEFRVNGERWTITKRRRLEKVEDAAE